ncbi:hemerythrin HHE cation-binding protein [Intrasporangium oryzae NRRL B-24470]|uniref:Hemerythrin HHE cation-binding protein n=1 Tax=Intrasporangium oryzae NRRL B-24470 TaxID=1386089 RepID=W9G0N6_9MICO|nr:hemerythrin domain-containing protein [Intrasporangium oryzae]EWS99630.1 hemerythrin HHE cation-binding protein [Intrasporangium oryzae NRRL B-24470]
MCEYCGCQQIPVIGELTAEHDAVVALIALVRRDLARDDRDAAARTTRDITAVLGPHTVVEEDGLFPLMADEFPDHIDALRDEHARIHTVLAESATAVPDDPAWPSRLLTTLELLREHILKEQDGVFPATLSVLDGDGWEQVERVRERAGSALVPASDAPPGHHHHPHESHDHDDHHHVCAG